jgi:hypothetical protein
VTVTNVGTNVTWNSATDEKGSYQVLDVPIGMYKVTVLNPSFAKITTEAQELEINQSLRIDVHLKLGAVNETVEVQSQASQVETVTASRHPAKLPRQWRCRYRHGAHCLRACAERRTAI